MFAIITISCNNHSDVVLCLNKMKNLYAEELFYIINFKAKVHTSKCNATRVEMFTMIKNIQIYKVNLVYSWVAEKHSPSQLNDT